MLIVAGGFQAGRPWAAGAAALLLALGFLGLAHALIETAAGEARRRDRRAAPGLRGRDGAHRRVASPLLLALTAAALWLPGSAIVDGARARARMSARPQSEPYRETVAAALADGWRFAGLHATARRRRVVRTLLVVADGDAPARDASTRADGVGAVDRRPRPRRRLGRARGARPLRRRLRRPRAAAAARRPRPRRSTAGRCRVRGDDPYQVAVGPIHAGVIESGHFRFHVVGDRILHLDARLFYKHRGLERAAEGTTLDDGLAVRRARLRRAARSRTRVAYAHACEEALGLAPTPELARARTILLELERVWSHLNDIAAVCAGVGLAAGNNRFAALTERRPPAERALTGHRFLFGIVARRRQRPRRSTRRRVADARDELAAIRADSARGLARAPLQRARSRTGCPTSASSTPRPRTRSAPSGRPRARPGSPRTSARRSPRLAYDGFEPRRSDARRRRRPGAARAARARAPASRSTSSTRLLDRPDPARRRRAAAADERAIGVGRVESPRGATSCIVERDGDRVDAAPPPHRLVRELAGRRPRRRRQPAARLPADQQELRALLRLRRPLMLTLLRDLRRLRRDDRACPRPTRGRSLAIRHVDAGSCNGCEHELTLVSSPYYDLAALRPRHRRLAAPRRRPARHRPRHDPHARALLAAYDAMPEPRRVAALGDCALGCNLLGSPSKIVGPVEAILPVDLRIPGCPPTPDAIAAALLALIDS